MDFDFDICRACGAPPSGDQEPSVVRVDDAALGHPRWGAGLRDVLDAVGERSRRAQGLSKPVTYGRSSHLGAQRVYLLAEGRTVLGLLKVGPKRLFVARGGSCDGLVEINPVCALDFYVVEGRQRGGLGLRLFKAMLRAEGLPAERMGYDRPSPKFLGFLQKHFGLSKYQPQNNHFVVFDRYFSSSGSSAAGTEPPARAAHAQHRDSGGGILPGAGGLELQGDPYGGLGQRPQQHQQQQREQMQHQHQQQHPPYQGGGPRSAAPHAPRSGSTPSCGSSRPYGGGAFGGSAGSRAPPLAPGCGAGTAESPLRGAGGALPLAEGGREGHHMASSGPPAHHGFGPLGGSGQLGASAGGLRSAHAGAAPPTAHSAGASGQRAAGAPSGRDVPPSRREAGEAMPAAGLRSGGAGQRRSSGPHGGGGRSPSPLHYAGRSALTPASHIPLFG